MKVLFEKPHRSSWERRGVSSAPPPPKKRKEYMKGVGWRTLRIVAQSFQQVRGLADGALGLLKHVEEEADLAE